VYDNIGPVNDISVSNSGIYIAYDGGVKSLNSSGGQIWSYNDYADNVRSISASQVDDVVYTGTGNAGTIKAINTTSVSSIWSFTGHGLGVNAIAAAPPSIQPDPPFPGWEDTAPLIRAVDQNGDPVRNATIEAWSVETESLADEVENKEARAQEIIDELDNVQPDQWTPPTQVDLLRRPHRPLQRLTTLGRLPHGPHQRRHGDRGMGGHPRSDPAPRI